MRNFFIKTFNRKTAVKVIIIRQDKRHRIHYVLPSTDGSFSIEKGTYKIDDNPYYDKKGFPTYFYKYNNVTPLNLDMDEIKAGSMKPEEYNTAINNKIAKDLFHASELVDSAMIAMFVSIAGVIILVAGLYYLNQEISGLWTMIREIHTHLGLGGVE